MNENDSQSHGPAERNTAERDLALLLALPDRLCPSHWARAIRFAGAFGRASAEYLAAPVRDGIRKGYLPFLHPTTYLDMIVGPSRADGAISQVDLDAWRRAFEDGRAETDPRVQSFAAGLAEGVAELTASVLHRRKVLARYLEVPQSGLDLAGFALGGIPAFWGKEGVFLVSHPSDADRLDGSGGRFPCDHRACGRTSRCREFLGHVIHRVPARR